MIHDKKNLIRRLSRAARPALLEAACEPDLLPSMVLANVMSPALWDFRNKIWRRPAGKENQTPDANDRVVMEEIHNYMDKHLFHVSPLEIEEIWGCVDLNEERKRLGAASVNYAMDVIRRAVEDRRELGILTEKQNILPLMDAERFPDYEYSTIELIRAHRTHLQRKKHRPIGITCCADEAVLSASLAWAAGRVPVEAIIIFGSPAHYCTLVRQHDHAHWFNGKHEYFDAQGWASEHDPRDPAGIHEAFLARVQGLDRIITTSGVHRFHTNESTMSPERLAQTHEAFFHFFGTKLRPIAETLKSDIRFVSDPLQEVSLQALDEAADASAARSCLQRLAREHPGSILDLAHYAFRDLWVEHPQAYLEAASRGHLARQRAAEIASTAEALDIVRGIEGDASIFNDSDRITLPDEVLLFGTGTHRDKALLLYTLLIHAPFSSKAAKENMELIFTEADSHVRTDNISISATTLLEQPDIREPELLRLPQKPSGESL